MTISTNGSCHRCSKSMLSHVFCTPATREERVKIRDCSRVVFFFLESRGNDHAWGVVRAYYQTMQTIRVPLIHSRYHENHVACSCAKKALVCKMSSKCELTYPTKINHWNGTYHQDPTKSMDYTFFTHSISIPYERSTL